MYNTTTTTTPSSNSTQQATNPTMYDIVNKELYNNCYVLDDDSCSMHSGSDPSNGRKSEDYLVDHIDDLEQAESLSQQQQKEASDVKQEFAFNLDQQRGRKRVYSGGDEMYAAKTSRKSVDTPSQSGISTQIPIQQQQSLLKGQKSGKNIMVKQENDQIGYVPDVTRATQRQPAKSSPSSSTGNGKSFYSRDDLFSDEVPSELFDENTGVSQHKIFTFKALKSKTNFLSQIIDFLKKHLQIMENKFNFASS